MPFPSNCPPPLPEDQCSLGAFLLPRPVLSLSHRSAGWKALSCSLPPKLVPPAAHGAPSAGGNAECEGP